MLDTVLWVIGVGGVGLLWYIARPQQLTPPSESLKEIPKPIVIKPENLDEILSNQKENIFLLDVRSQKEFKKGQKIDAAHNVPVSFIMYKIKTIPRDKKIVAICASGNRSLTASSLLLMQGFADVVTLEGGMNAWLAYKKISKTGVPTS